jgi:hypothetical protein
MSEMLSHVSAISVFLGIAAVGFLFLLVSLVFGGIFDHLELGHGFDHDLSHGGPGFFSTRVLSVFITAFGGFGAIGVSQGYGIFASSFFGAVGGLVLASVIYFFARFLFGQQASSATSAADLVGRTAEVTVGIPGGGVGLIRCLIGESMIDKIARSRDGAAVPHNSLVKIEEVIGESVIVSPLAISQSSQPVADPTRK